MAILASVSQAGMSSVDALKILVASTVRKTKLSWGHYPKDPKLDYLASQVRGWLMAGILIVLGGGLVITLLFLRIYH